MLELFPSTTAEAVCLFRALEARRPPAERILDDPYAQHFLSPVTRAALNTGVTGALAEFVSHGLQAFAVMRHRYIDEVVLDAHRQGLDQLVLLGAGYDTRAFRLTELNDLPFFEVDFPSTGQRKARRVEQLGSELPERRVIRVPIDFHTDELGDVLVDAGLNVTGRTMWVWEGVSMYLSRQAIRSTLTTMKRLSAPGSHLAMDFWFLPDGQDAKATAMRMSGNLLALLGEPITFGMHPEDVGDFFRRDGWALEHSLLPEDAERKYPGRNTYRATYVTHARSV